MDRQSRWEARGSPRVVRRTFTQGLAATGVSCGAQGDVSTSAAKNIPEGSVTHSAGPNRSWVGSFMGRMVQVGGVHVCRSHPSPGSGTRATSAHRGLFGASAVGGTIYAVGGTTRGPDKLAVVEDLRHGEGHLDPKSGHADSPQRPLDGRGRREGLHNHPLSAIKWNSTSAGTSALVYPCGAGSASPPPEPSTVSSTGSICATLRARMTKSQSGSNFFQPAA